MATTTKLSLDAFLALPETEPPCEYTQGEVEQKPMPTVFHSLIVTRLGRLLDEYLERTREAVVMTEPRHADRAADRVYLPDVAVVRRERLPADRAALARGPLWLAPDLAVEVLSPDDRPARVADKVGFYVRSGVAVTWVIDPVARTLAEHRPGAEPRTWSAGEQVSAAPVLPAFVLDLDRLFAVLEP